MSSIKLADETDAQTLNQLERDISMLTELHDKENEIVVAAENSFSRCCSISFG